MTCERETCFHCLFALYPWMEKSDCALIGYQYGHRESRLLLEQLAEYGVEKAIEILL